SRFLHFADINQSFPSSIVFLSCHRLQCPGIRPQRGEWFFPRRVPLAPEGSTDVAEVLLSLKGPRTMVLTWFRKVAQGRMARAARRREARRTREVLEDRALPSASALGDGFVILMENHNWTQPSSFTGVPQIQGSASAPYINNTLTQI